VGILQRTVVFPPGAAVGYLVDGATGAASGLLIPAEPLLIVWIFGTR